MTPQEEEFAEEIRQMLDERFGDEFEFGPIVVRTELNDDMLFFNSYIVFDGDVDKLDPAKTSSMGGPLWDRAVELGYPGVPFFSYVLKSEWPGLLRSLTEAWKYS